MTVSRFWSAAGTVAIAVILIPLSATKAPRAAAPPGPYVVTDLGTFGSIQSASAYDINDAGQVVGEAASRAFVWQNGAMTALGTLGGNAGIAQAINAFGQSAGASTAAIGSASRAVRWDQGVVTDLMAGDGSTAGGINDSGQIVGNISYGIAFFWQHGVITNLGHLGGGGGFAADINNAGQVVGSSYTTEVTEMGLMQHAFLWQNGVMTDLGLLPGDEDSGAAGINNLGQIVGSSGRTDPQTYETTYRAFVYDGGVMTPLPVPSSDSYAGDINDAGVVVGTMRAGGGFSSHHAFVYAEGVVTDLNTLIPTGSGLHLLYANAINNAGQIVGVAYDSRAHYHAFLLTPAAPGTPVVQIGDASVTEGQTGTRAAGFTVTLSPASSEPVTVSYSTANGSATAGSDYQSASGTVTFAAGETAKPISVLVNGDRAGEPNETFVVNVGLTSGAAVVGDAQGLGTIVDDEPRVSIDSVSKNEGQSGTTPFAFTVNLSSASDAAVSLNFATANGDAKSGEDFDAKSGSLSFTAGQTSKTITVMVGGDRKVESQEVFYVNLSGVTGAFLVNNQGVGVIRNDDR
jgi:probable HAF family extracellular repeat protein